MEVYYNGEWGTVCDDGWDDTDAGVVCRQLGFGSSGTSYSSAYFGQGSGPTWLDNIHCTGNESTLASCGHLGLNISTNCSHTEDAGVRCYDGIQGKNVCNLPICACSLEITLVHCFGIRVHVHPEVIDNYSCEIYIVILTN